MNDLIFRSKKDASGNTYYLIIDLEKKTIKNCSNMGFDFYLEGIETYKKSLNIIQAKLEAAGFITDYI